MAKMITDILPFLSLPSDLDICFLFMPIIFGLGYKHYPELMLLLAARNVIGIRHRITVLFDSCCCFSFFPVFLFLVLKAFLKESCESTTSDM